MLRAGIDIGTNTILLLVAEVKNGRVARVLEDHVRVVRLGQGVDQNRAFHPEALDRARKCFAEYAEILRRYPGVRVKAAATSGSRDAANSAAFFEEVRRSYGIPVEVISGEEEALYSFLGGVPEGGNDPCAYAVLDIGGGSTEIVGQEPSGALFRYSFDLGCVRMTERFLRNDPATREELEELRRYVVAVLAEKRGLLEEAGRRQLIGVAGTATYLASASLGLPRFDLERVHGARLSAAAVDELIRRFLPMTASERIGIGGMDRGRADVILGGAVILREVLRMAGLQELTASVRGLRYGLVGGG
ncbi:MAG: Ppx/GppA family phosphatase [Bdellovibrionales bacterium]|nr:Ppx/GppA family phosphatase [Bdellovibrionales bacterium]